MPRPRTAHVADVKSALAARLADAFAPAGGRFLSARAVAQRFAVSYQTAHRLLAELETEGRLRRRAASGTFHLGRAVTLRGVQLVFHPRARRKGSFGGHLLALLEAALRADGIDVVRSWPAGRAVPRLCADRYPVIWDCPDALAAAAAARRPALCLNERPPPGLGGVSIDAVTTDDFSGGACAAELLKQRTGCTDGFVVLGGPPADARSRQRIAGFRSQAGVARVVCAANWFVEGGAARAAEVLRDDPVGIFACNDRLAQAVLVAAADAGRAPPPLVGFDNAPIATRLRLTSIGIPWAAFVAEALALVRARLAGRTDGGRLVCLAHEPALRLTC